MEWCKIYTLKKTFHLKINDKKNCGNRLKLGSTKSFHFVYSIFFFSTPSFAKKESNHPQWRGHMCVCSPSFGKMIFVKFFGLQIKWTKQKKNHQQTTDALRQLPIMPYVKSANPSGEATNKLTSTRINLLNCRFIVAMFWVLHSILFLPFFFYLTVWCVKKEENKLISLITKRKRLMDNHNNNKFQ